MGVDADERGDGGVEVGGLGGGHELVESDNGGGVVVVEAGEWAGRSLGIEQGDDEGFVRDHAEEGGDAFDELGGVEAGNGGPFSLLFMLLVYICFDAFSMFHWFFSGAFLVMSVTRL